MCRKQRKYDMIALDLKFSLTALAVMNDPNPSRHGEGLYMHRASVKRSESGVLFYCSVFYFRVVRGVDRPLALLSHIQYDR